MSKDLAIIAGDGQLPVILSSKMPYATCVVFEGMPHKLRNSRLIPARFEKLGGNL